MGINSVFKQSEYYTLYLSWLLLILNRAHSKLFMINDYSLVKHQVKSYEGVLNF